MATYKLILNDQQQRRAESKRTRDAICADLQLRYDLKTEIRSDNCRWYALLTFDGTPPDMKKLEKELNIYGHLKSYADESAAGADSPPPNTRADRDKTA